jgi:hypothetical protein
VPDAVTNQNGAPERCDRNGRWPAVVALLGTLATSAAQAQTAPAAPATPAEAAPAHDASEGEARLKTAETALARQSGELSALRAEIAAERVASEQTSQALERKVSERLDALPPTLRMARAGYGLTGFLQVDAPFRQSSQNQLNGSTGEPLNQNRVYLRRARLRFTMDRKYGAGGVELDANTISGPTARAVGAEASVKLPGADGAPPLVMLTIGLFKTPFGYEIAQSDRDRLFMERSTAEQALFPGEYDGGVRLSGGWRFVRYALAAMNGEPIGERSYPGRDPNKWKDLVGRLGVETPVAGPVAVWGGVSALSGHGFHRGTTATKDTVQWRDLNDNRTVDTGELTVLPGSAPTPSFDFSRTAVGGDLGVRVSWPVLGETVLYGEAYVAQNLDRGLLPYDPSSPTAAKARELGWYLAGTQQLTPWAAVGVRYDFYNPDRDSTEGRVGRVFTRSRSFRSLALAGAFTTPYGRLMVEYDVNRNHQGRDLQGQPTNLKDNALIFRGQVNF